MGSRPFVLLFHFRNDHLLKANWVKPFAIKRLLKKKSIINYLPYQGDLLQKNKNHQDAYLCASIRNGKKSCPKRGRGGLKELQRGWACFSLPFPV
jgi:hypothetical protein